MRSRIACLPGSRGNHPRVLLDPVSARVQAGRALAHVPLRNQVHRHPRLRLVEGMVPEHDAGGDDTCS